MNPPLNRTYFALTQLSRALSVVATLQDWFLLRFQLRHRFGLPFDVRFPLCLDLFDALFDLRDPQCDFLLFLLEFLQGHDFVPEFWKICRLRSSFAPENDFAFLQQPFFVPQYHARKTVVAEKRNRSRA